MQTYNRNLFLPLMSSRGKRKALPRSSLSTSHVPFRNPSLKRVHFTTTSDAGSSRSTTTIGRLPVAPTTHVEIKHPGPLNATPDIDINAPRPKLDSQRTQVSAQSEDFHETDFTLYQNGQLLDDFADHFDVLGDLILEYEADPDSDLPCTCGIPGTKRTTQGYDCTAYAATCSDCFVKSHLQNPFHWAEVWDAISGFFVRHDISKLGKHIIQLGHNGGPCSNPVGERMFTIIDDNGIHSTKLAFCGCQELPPNKNKQLMRTSLFPATTKDPHTAFTINMLKRFQLHNFESKKAAYDYLGAVRRLSDNSFTADVQVSFAQ